MVTVKLPIQDLEQEHTHTQKFRFLDGQISNLYTFFGCTLETVRVIVVVSLHSRCIVNEELQDSRKEGWRNTPRSVLSVRYNFPFMRKGISETLNESWSK